MLASVTYDYRGQRGNDIGPTGLPNVHEAVSQILSEKLPASAAYWPLDDISQQHGSPSREDAVAPEVQSAPRQRLRARDRTRRECSSTCRLDRRCPTCDGSDRMFLPLRTWIQYRCDILLPLSHGDDDSTGSTMEPSRCSTWGRSRLMRAATEGDASKRHARPPVRQRSPVRVPGCSPPATGVWRNAAGRNREDFGNCSCDWLSRQAI